MFTRAIVRPPGSSFAEGLTTAGLGEPDLPRALEQHRIYVDALRACGLDVTVLEPDVLHPDSTFVEDTAVLTPRLAVLTRPGAPSRAGEVVAIGDVLAEFYPALNAIFEPGTLEGGDICEAGPHFFLGISHRTNAEGARQLGTLLSEAGYTSSPVDIRAMEGLLHLKSGLTSLGDGRLLAIDALAGHEAFRAFEVVRVPRGEEYAANGIRVNESILLPAGYPGTEERLEALGYPVVTLEMSEFRKMDGGLSCLSLRF